MQNAARKLFACLLLLAPAAFAACDDGGGGDDVVPLVLEASCFGLDVQPAGPQVSLRCGTITEGVVTVEIVGASIDEEFNGYNFRILFDPTVFRYTGFVNTQEPFVGTCSDANALFCLDNLADADNDSVVVYSVTQVGADPSGVQLPGPTEAVLGELIFEAIQIGDSSLSFENPVEQRVCLDQTEGSALLDINPLAACLDPIETLGGVDFVDAGVTLTAATP